MPSLRLPRFAHSLFARLFGISVISIVLAHCLAFVWFQAYGKAHDDARMQVEHLRELQAGEPLQPPPHTLFGGPVVPLVIQMACLVAAAWYGAKLLSRPIQRFSAAAERLSDDLDSPPLPVLEYGLLEARQATQTFNHMQWRIREQLRQRGYLLGAVSHDLRTPLSRLKLRLELYDEAREHMDMRQDIDEMVKLLDATLALVHERPGGPPTL
ncbi:sensor histidine kinase [Pseudomonas sp. M47T1]|uniref:histidine kinase dimerization/phospho-acceptor domain-containing protein n=1 Tax=unclassified Pseudomonas TaxID=196821 RepID=UPI0002608993|nr:histidine kinase dimerization/phospho-acceptor domain-containing protein [Pseudomonas sp. M47T1]EIK95820.1 sensor histidine kinase [Pseudomonas sp. M47T1]